MLAAMCDVGRTALGGAYRDAVGRVAQGTFSSNPLQLERDWKCRSMTAFPPARGVRVRGMNRQPAWNNMNKNAQELRTQHMIARYDARCSTVEQRDS